MASSRSGTESIDHGRRGRVLAAVGSAVIVLTAACSLYLDWDWAGLPCDADKECYEGYSCLVNRCVLEHSLPVGETCSEDIQCAEDNTVCGSNPFTCRESCNAYYRPTSDCGKALFCRPERVGDGASAQLQGTCFGSECTLDADCDATRICVTIELDAGACLSGCEYEIAPATGDHADNCGSVASNQLYCQPIGLPNDSRLVCLERIGNDDGNTENNTCDSIENPCKQFDDLSGKPTGLVCVEGLCHELCNPAPAVDVCESGKTCCPVRNRGDVTVYSVCKTNCD
jgi:hypothetical protein